MGTCFSQNKLDLAKLLLTKNEPEHNFNYTGNVIAKEVTENKIEVYIEKLKKSMNISQLNFGLEATLKELTEDYTKGSHKKQDQNVSKLQSPIFPTESEPMDVSKRFKKGLMQFQNKNSVIGFLMITIDTLEFNKCVINVKKRDKCNTTETKKPKSPSGVNTPNLDLKTSDTSLLKEHAIKKTKKFIILQTAENTFYIAGGVGQGIEEENEFSITGNFYEVTYDEKWKELSFLPLANVPNGCIHSTMCNIDNYIYLVGGMDSIQKNIGSYRYDIKENTWTEIGIAGPKMVSRYCRLFTNKDKRLHVLNNHGQIWMYNDTVDSWIQLFTISKCILGFELWNGKDNEIIVAMSTTDCKNGAIMSLGSCNVIAINMKEKSYRY